MRLPIITSLTATRPWYDRHQHRHLTDIETIAIVLPGALDGLKLGDWFRWLATEFGARIFRMKGILAVWGDPDRFIFQGVQTGIGMPPRLGLGRRRRAGQSAGSDRTQTGRRAHQTGFADVHLPRSGPAGGRTAADPFRRSLYEISPCGSSKSVTGYARTSRIAPRHSHRDQGSAVRKAGLPANRDRDHRHPAQ